jgi:hypothetical protein
MYRRIAFALAALAASAAAAQGGPSDPSSPQAKAAPLEYRSAFEGYRRFTDEQPAAWRESNESVKGDAGAHSAHGEKAPTDAKPASKPPAGHGGHGDHK